MAESATIYDISPAIDKNLCVWPGDTPPTREVLCDMTKGDNLTLSTLHTTVHVGAHVDAPNHYSPTAPPIDQRPLDLYIGPCRVVHVDAKRGSRVTLDMLNVPFDTPRLLIATGTYPDPNAFNDDFAGLDPALINDAHQHGVRLIGIDTPSVDLFHSKDLPAHNAFLENDMAILEGIILRDVPDGLYELVALPLNLTAFDASPVRAILRTIPI
jgi:arylformamidase